MSNIPEEFFKLIESYGSPPLNELRGALLTDPSTSVRVNRGKGARPAKGAELVKWCADGVYLAERGRFTFDPAMHQGLYYVQDASSMFTAHVVGQLTADGLPCLLLDSCAAPGGKTTAAISALPEGSVVVANEYDPRRCSVLRENLAKWGYPCVAVTQGDTRRFAERTAETFDIVLADVPCSGEGMMRKEAVAAEQWSLRLIEECAERQRVIVDNVWRALRPGGYLVYSTCTFNRAENEEVVEYLIGRYGAESIEIVTADDWGIEKGVATAAHCYRFIPGRIRGEGLFMAVLRKPGEAAAASKVKGKGRGKVKERGGKVPKLPAGIGQWLTVEGDLRVEGEMVEAVLANPLAQRLPEEMRPRVRVATLKGTAAIPSQELALSLALRRGAFAEVEVDAPTALDYLRAMAVALPDDAPRGVVLLTHGGIPLGFAKNLGKRANNLYPRQWRVLTAGEPPARVGEVVFGHTEKI